MTKLGFGFMRLPLVDKKSEHGVDFSVLNQMVDAFIEGGGTYFDTAYTYLGGDSERAVGVSLSKRYPRNAFVLADKLPSWMIREHEDCQRIFDEQLSRCNVEYFDVYLLHWLNEVNYISAKAFGGFDFLKKLKEEGKALKIGFSFHDSPKLLDKILSEHPEMDIVQLQINYLDWESPAILAKECYEVAKKHGKEIVVMEPLKGGTLLKLPQEAKKCLEENSLNEVSAALGFAKNLPMVKTVLSGMNSIEQISENIKEQPEFSEKELSALEKVAEIIRSETAVPCTGCSYCESTCPVKIPITKYFEIYNEYCRNPEEDWKIEHAYNALTANFSRPSDCLRCRACELNCPQKINISQMLINVSRAFGH